MTEYEIHKTVVQHLHARARPGVVWFHVPNGGSRHPAEAANLKRMGTLAGVSDLILLFYAGAYALELKSGKGKLTDAQEDFQTRWRAAGGYAYTAHGVDEAIAWLELNGLIA